jgi:hypothetical protein
MNIPEPYRGIAYSVTKIGDGKWRWTFHQKPETGVMSRIIRGEIFGTQDDAIAAAKAAIDKEIG